MGWNTRASARSVNDPWVRTRAPLTCTTGYTRNAECLSLEASHDVSSTVSYAALFRLRLTCKHTHTTHIHLPAVAVATLSK
jgi:hypothetical protein